MSENQDLLDLCRLNQMEEKLEETMEQTNSVAAFEKENTLKAIAWKKRDLSRVLSEQGLSFSEEQIKKHRDQFTTK